MKILSLILLLLLISFSLAKKDELLQKMYDDLSKRKIEIPNDSFKYIKNFQVKMSTISKIISKSQLSSLEEIGIPKYISLRFKNATYSTTDIITSKENWGLTLTPSSTQTSSFYEIGAAQIKGDKARFAYFNITGTADTIKQKEKKVVEKCQQQPYRVCWNEIQYVERNVFTQDEIVKISDTMYGKVRKELLNAIKLLMDISTDGDNFLSTDLKFLA